MANVLVERSYLEDIADSIRAKLGVADTYKPSEMSDAIDSISGGGITPTGTININSNGTHDVTQYASAAVAVPNSYSASDEGKVVNNGGLVSQTSDTVTQNGTVDTTLINSLTVNVSGGGSSTATGTYTPTENTNNHTFDVGGSYDHFVLYAETNPSDQGARALRAIIADFSQTNYLLCFFTTNNSGASVACPTYYGTGTVSKSGSTVTYNNSANYMIAGVSYRWVAW